MSNHGEPTPSPAPSQPSGWSQSLPVWVVQTAIILLLLLLALGFLLGIESVTDKILTFFSHLAKNPDIRRAFVLVAFGIIVLALLLVAILEGFRAYQRTRKEEAVARATVQELKLILDPTKEESPLHAFFAQAQLLATPTDAESPLHPIFKIPDGHLLTAVEQARAHIEEAKRLLGEISKNVDADKIIGEMIAQDHRDFRNWSERWRQTAKGVLEALKAEYFKKRGLLMEPADYATFLPTKEKIHFHDQKKGHCATIRLCGSMVGFSFLLPDSLRDHACEAETNFQSLKILSVDIQHNGQDIFWHPVYLVVQTLKGVWLDCDQVQGYIRDKGHTIIIEIRYVDHDLLAALYDVSGGSLAVLQSLDTDNFMEILKSTDAEPSKKRYQLGFSFDDIEGEKDEYSRYSKAFGNLWTTYCHRSEVWVLHNFGASALSSAFLKIWSPRWECDLLDPKTIRPKEVGDFNKRAKQVHELMPNKRDVAEFLKKAASADITILEHSVRSFLEGMVENIPRKNSDIEKILELFNQKPEQLGQLRGNPCLCKTQQVHSKIAVTNGE